MFPMILECEPNAGGGATLFPNFGSVDIEFCAGAPKVGVELCAGAEADPNKSAVGA